MTTDLQALWQENRRWRQWMDANTPFVTPETLDTLRYMLIECCEVLDLWMRDRNPNHARNNERNSTIYQEMADVAMLALTALPYWEGAIVKITFNADLLAFHAISAIRQYAPQGFPMPVNNFQWNHWVHTVILDVLAYPGFDLAAELDKCHRRLAWKHGSAALAAAGCENPWMVEAEAVA